MNQIKGTVLSMAAIRSHRPDAMLVQTEDLGYTRAVPALRYQADFENQRRWLTFDLLCGMVDQYHPLAAYLLKFGVTPNELRWLVEHHCRPDLLGLNYYILSQRYLDDDPALLDGSGGNGRHQYADLEAVRSCGMVDISDLLRQVSWRYDLPMAITEVHLACTREEQLRWLAEIHEQASAAAANGIDVVAVTAWSLFGAFDWNSLCTRQVGCYEPGAFDVRSDPPRQTALGSVIKQLANGMTPEHPVLSGKGWWHRCLS
jgi:dTDP-4-dehydrorhamnose reductase